MARIVSVRLKTEEVEALERRINGRAVSQRRTLDEELHRIIRRNLEECGEIEISEQD